jgi:hypothetical protein
MVKCHKLKNTSVTLGILTHTLLIRNTRVWIRCSSTTLPLDHYNILLLKYLYIFLIFFTHFITNGFKCFSKTNSPDLRQRVPIWLCLLSCGNFPRCPTRINSRSFNIFYVYQWVRQILLSIIHRRSSGVARRSFFPAVLTRSDEEAACLLYYLAWYNL